MLDALRSATGGWIAKIFIVLLSGSFAVWGIADIFGGYGGAAIATVGETEVSNDSFRVAFQNQIQRISRQTGRPLSLEQARTYNLHGQVLGELIAQATLDNDAANKGLGISDEAIGRGILEDPLFHDSFGTFSRSAYEQFLAFSGMTEVEYVDERRRARMRRQLASSLTSGSVAPQVLSDAFYRFNNETRVVRYLVLGSDSIESIGAPDEAVLVEYFENNRADFRAPEYRRLEIIEADAATISSSVEVAEQDILDLFESRAEVLKTPEKREIQQILFTSQADADAAAQKIADGTDFPAIGTEMGLSEADLSLGLVAASEIFDTAIRDAAFALAEGAISDPVQGALGFAILYVAKIEPEMAPTLENVRESLRSELAQDLAQDRALDLFDTIEDDRAAGLTFAETAAKHNVKYRVVEALDQQGKDADDKPVTDIPQINDIIQVAFDTDPGVEADPIQLIDNGFVWVNVTDISDSRDRTIDEVRETLAERWRSEEQRTRMSESANELKTRLNTGGTLENIAATNGLEIKTSAPLKRSFTDSDFDQAGTAAIFATPTDGAGSALHANGTDRILFRLTAIALEPFDPASDESKEMAESLTLSVSEDMLGTYVRVKQEKFGVSVNQRNLDLLTGLASDQGQY